MNFPKGAGAVLSFSLLTAFIYLFVFTSETAGQQARIAYWKLDETSSPTTYAEMDGGLNGSCVGICPTATITGQVNGAQLFDGSSTGINITPDASLDWGVNDSFSVELWVKGEPGQSCAAADEVLLGRADGSAGTGLWALGCTAGTGKASFQLRDANNTGVALESTRVITDGLWHHVVAMRDGVNDVNYLTVDGTDIVSAIQDYTGEFAPITAVLSLGHLESTAHFRGALDEVALYNGLVPTTDILTHYYLGRGYTASCASPVNIMPLGNSITAGYGSGDAPTSDPYFIGYRRPLYLSMVTASYYFDFVGSLEGGSASTGPTFDYDHEGHGGARAEQIASSVVSYLTANPADVILLHIGTNDVAQNQGPSVADVVEILDNIDSVSEDITVIVARIIGQDPNHVPYYDVTPFNDNLAAMVQSRIASGDKLILVDQQSALNYPADLFDWLHPDTDGYAKMAPVWLAALDDFMPACVTPTITSTPVVQVSVNQPYTYDVDASGSPAPTFALLTNPAGMTIDPVSGIISWTPNSSQVGFHAVEVEASNSSGTDTQSFTVEVVDTLVCLAADPITYWQLDENSGTTFVDSINDLNATCSGIGCPNFVSGQVSGALYFDGINDGLGVTDAPELDWGNSSNFTIQAWVKTTQICTGNKVFVGKSRYPSSGGDWWLGCGDSSNAAVFFLRDSNNNISSVSGTTAINDGNWHHLVAVRDGVAKVNRLYVDGVEQGSVTATNITGNIANASPLTIGYYTTLGQYRVDGVIDEVAIHGRALTPTEVRYHYNSGLAGINYCSLTPPTILSTPVTGVVPDSTYTYNVESTGNPAPTFSLVSNPAGMTINANTGVITWSSAGESPGASYPVEVRASNSAGADTQSFAIVVYYTNYLPLSIK